MEEKYNIVLKTELAQKKPHTVGNKQANNCPFCNKNGIQTEHILKETEEFVWFKNKFPTLEDTDQTLILETMSCDEDITTYSKEYLHRLFDFVFARRTEMIHTGKYKEVILFKNHGIQSCSSIHHAHIQLVGLEKTSYQKQLIEDFLEGSVIYENEKTKVTVSKTPSSEFYEFNIVWEKDVTDKKHIDWLQYIVQFILQTKFKNTTDYNIVFHETETQGIFKVYPRKPNSILFIGFGLRQEPSDVPAVANSVKEFVTKKEKKM